MSDSFPERVPTVSRVALSRHRVSRILFFRPFSHRRSTSEPTDASNVRPRIISMPSNGEVTIIDPPPSSEERVYPGDRPIIIVRTYEVPAENVDGLISA